MYYVKHARESGDGRLKALVMLFFFLLSVSLLEAAVRPVILSAAENRARAEFGRMVSIAASESFDKNNTNLTEITRDADGNITSVSLNSPCAGRLNAAIALDAERLMSENAEALSIPIGSLTGLSFLSGRGAKIKIKLTAADGVHTELYSRFFSAGINQTLHRVVCRVEADVLIIAAGKSERMTLTADVVVSETVIVGRVPDSYTTVNGDQSDTISRIFDYGDPYGTNISG